jgi:DNA-directed RNA polymerase specialized sigma24 family protein
MPQAMTSGEFNDRFATTRWSVVLGAGGQISRIDARRALADLCETYWPPLYAYLRRNGSSAADAEDAVQGFFALLLERGDFARVQPERGRFRSFLLASLKHYQSNVRDREAAVKRGGGRPILSLDVHAAENQYNTEPVDHRTPESLFDYRWARTVLDRTWAQLRNTYETAGRSERFDALSPYLAGHDQVPYAQAGAALAMTEGAVKVAVHRMRREFRDLLRAEIAQTVASADDIDREIASLFEALSG